MAEVQRPTAKQIPCPPVERLRAYVDGRLDDDDARPVKNHLAACAVCEAAADALHRAGKKAPPPEPSVADEPVITGDPSRASASDLAAEEPQGLAEQEFLAALTKQGWTCDGRYEVEGGDPIGEGGFGDVYRARDQKLGRDVALKILQLKWADNAEYVQRFRREVAHLGRLKHPNIVLALDSGTFQGRPYLVTEFVEGETLARIIREVQECRRPPLPLHEACRIAYEAAEGLQHIHEKKLVHCDIKPSNLMRASDGTVKVLDLGIALAASPDSLDGPNVTRSRQILGTLEYMSPEARVSRRLCDIRSDIYSLAQVLSDLLAPHNACVEGADPRLYKVNGIVNSMGARDPALRFAEPRFVVELLAPFTKPPAPALPRKETPWWSTTSAKVGIALFALAALLLSLFTPRRQTWQFYREDRFEESLVRGNWKVVGHAVDPDPRLENFPRPYVMTNDGWLMLRNRGCVRWDEEFRQGVAVEFDWLPAAPSEEEPGLYRDCLTVALRCNGRLEETWSHEAQDGIRVSFYPVGDRAVNILTDKRKQVKKAAPVKYGEVNHIRITDDGRHIHAYLNGVLVNECEAPDSSPYHYFMIYNREPVGGTMKESWIDNVRIEVPRR